MQRSSAGSGDLEQNFWCGPVKRKDTRKRVGDRHKPGYMRDYMRKYRARKKASGALQAPRSGD